MSSPSRHRLICVINAHPDPSPERLSAALAQAYSEGARQAGHRVDTISVGALDLACLADAAEFATPPPEPVLSEREKIKAADHVAIIFPLWMGAMPAKARAFFEHAARAGYFLETRDASSANHWPKQNMKGKSARVVVTMGMPAPIYRFVLGAHSVKGFEQGVLAMSGFKPIRHTILGGVGAVSANVRKDWMNTMGTLGAKAA